MTEGNDQINQDIDTDQAADRMENINDEDTHTHDDKEYEESDAVQNDDSNNESDNNDEDWDGIRPIYILSGSM